MNPGERPEKFKDENNDCTVRSLSLVANLPYEEVHAAFEIAGRKKGKGVSGKKVIQQVCQVLNLQAKQVKRSGSLKKLKATYPKGRLWCLKSGHAFALIDGVVHGELTNAQIRGAWMIEKKPDYRNACKICILAKGLKGSELDTCPYVFKTEEQFIKHLEEVHHFTINEEGKQIHVCCLCFEKFVGYGNNPMPLAEGLCCDKCNAEKVIPARMEWYARNPKVR